MGHSVDIYRSNILFSSITYQEFTRSFLSVIQNYLKAGVWSVAFYAYYKLYPEWWCRPHCMTLHNTFPFTLGITRLELPPYCPFSVRAYSLDISQAGQILQSLLSFLSTRNNVYYIKRQGVGHCLARSVKVRGKKKKSVKRDAGNEC